VFAIFCCGVSLRLFTNDVVTEVNTLVTDKNRRPGDQLTDLVLAFATEGTVEQFFAGFF
jgi:hypothetical protein